MMENRKIIENILSGKPIREALDDELPNPDLYDLTAIQKDLDAVLKDAGASNFYSVETFDATHEGRPALKVVLIKNDSMLTNLENGIDRKMEGDLGLTKLYTLDDKDGNIAILYR